ncbi:caspase A isoform X2 [Nilaparvata lugens]|uniref:caspase A isoform X2 n=2 Tax=Nilaparvata lugens TaxID=108931 RepID=UPI00193CE641|nr:caspase A isoform X2 [Nilaparvata lugens]
MYSQGEERRITRKRRRKKKKRKDTTETGSIDLDLESISCDMECKTESIVCSNSNRNLDDILQVWKDACNCQNTVLYEERIEQLLETIEVLKEDIAVAKSHNSKLMKENDSLKLHMKRLAKRLRHMEGHHKHSGLSSQSEEENTLTIKTQDSSDLELHTWIFPTEQWLNFVSDAMNPSTDSDNFEMSVGSKEQSAMERVEESDNSGLLFEGDDEVFDEAEDFPRQPRTPRVRRISDVIDSIGESPSHLTKDRTYTFPTIETSSTYYSAMTEFKLQSPPKGRPRSTVTDGLMSPPQTPGSDPGYMSTGTPTTPSTLYLRRKAFRFSASSVDMAGSPPRHWDATQIDAKAFANQTQYEQPSVVVKTTTAPMAAEKCARVYNMNHKKRGRTLIFNHEEFTDMPARDGSGIDVKRLECAFKSLDFEVDVYQDLKVEKLKEVINEVSLGDHKDEDCLVVIVLTHGLGNGMLFARDYAYPVEHLWAPFAGDKCLSLAGKPKLFFIQACRGEKLDGGLTLVNCTQTDNNLSSYKIPSMADFLLAFSTFEGHYSWRNPEKGTWFIQALCEVLEEEGTKSSLQEILLEVSRRVATNHESYNDMIAWQHQKKQVPQINSTLLRQVYFNPKQTFNED